MRRNGGELRRWSYQSCPVKGEDWPSGQAIPEFDWTSASCNTLIRKWSFAKHRLTAHLYGADALSIGRY
ncbi:hypothetical protein GCM10007874_32020 [Labrys miyagiensis]|uniref:Uncharacterized protein n=1 Tax=Labrys miyagiensis TaxID=346912 RepID=A0ABQ6CMS0_9HYPH|nr:hypothetical protein GCM10007874_32020 [Labrys miyagiensis]